MSATISFIAGSSFWVSQAEPHLWFIISEPQQYPEEVVIANVTTARDSVFAPKNDRSCVVQPGEHPFVTSLSYVYYAGARMTSVGHLKSRFHRGDLHPHEPASAELLLRMRKGALESHFIPFECGMAIERQCSLD